MKKTLIMLISDNNLEFINRGILEIGNIEEADLLIIDEASEYDILEEIAEHKSVKCILHTLPLGYGACIVESINYANSFEYEYLITADCRAEKFRENISTIQNNLNYGYDIVTCSRILENYKHELIEDDIIEMLDAIALSLRESTGLDLTDPLSPDKGLGLKNMEQIFLTEEGQGALLQLFVQAVYFGYAVIEIPAEEDMKIGRNDFDSDEPLDEFLSIIETEKYLYSKGSIN